MAKIPFLHAAPRADGVTVAWHWKPSPRLRKAGWENHHLGDGPAPRNTRGRGKPIPPEAVVAKANALNRQLEAWDLGVLAADRAAPPAPRNLRWIDLEDIYRASDEYRAIEPATRREYDARMAQLRFWAQDGQLLIRQIDQAMVKDLRKALMPLHPADDDEDDDELEAAPDGRSIFKCAAMLRVLRLLLRFAVRERFLPGDPTEGVPIPSTPSRTQRLPWREVQAIAARADCNATAALALPVAFWSMLRRNELHQLNRFQWQELHGADPRDLPALVNGRGQVWGFRLQPNKTRKSTGRWVDCPMPPWLHAPIEAAFERSQWLFPHHADGAAPLSAVVLRRRVKPVLVAAGYPDHQLRDMRRSGMSGLVDLGAERSDVFTISGHTVLGGRRSMADVYMPPDTRAACRAVAAACRTLAKIEAAERAEREEGQ